MIDNIEIEKLQKEIQKRDELLEQARPTINEVVAHIYQGEEKQRELAQWLKQVEELIK